jgi:transposase
MDLEDVTKKQIEIFYTLILEIESHIINLEHLIYQSGEDVQEEVKILSSIPGVSCLGALAIISDIADISRFPNPKKFCSYLRSVPGLDSSNTTVRTKRINKCSRKLTMTYLVQGVHHIRKKNPKLEATYKKLRQGKTYGKSVVAIARHTITHIFYMLRDKELYHYREEEKHKKKLRVFEKNLNVA